MKAVQIAENINNRLDRLMPLVAPTGVVLGFIFSGVFIHVRPYVSSIFGLITLAGALKLQVAEFGNAIRRPIPILAFFISTHVLMPLFAMLASSVFFNGNQELITGYSLLFAGPTAVASFIWVTLFQGDKALCLTVILLDTLLAPLVVPGTVSILMGAKVTMDMSGIAVSLLLMVVFPTIIGVTLNETSRGKIPDVLCPWLNPLSKILLALVIAANTSPVAKIIRFDDPLIWKISALYITLSSTGFIMSNFIAIAVKCNREKRVVLYFTGGLKNNTAITTIAVTFFPTAAALPALVSFIFQHTISVLLGRLLIRKRDS